MIDLKGMPIKKELMAKLRERIANGESFVSYLIYDPKSFEAKSYIDMIHKVIVKLELPYLIKEVSSYEECKKVIEEANNDKEAMVFLARPLTFGGEKELIEMVDPSKDADMLTSKNIGHLVKGDLNYLSGTSSSVRKILDYYDIDVEAKRTLVVGRSVSVGMPIAQMLIKKNALVSLVHSRIKPEVIREYARNSELIVLCSGQRDLVRKEDIPSDAVVIDCGFKEDLKGDLGFTPECKAFTPVPGGVGPLTIVSLLENAFFLKYNH